MTHNICLKKVILCGFLSWYNENDGSPGYMANKGISNSSGHNVCTVYGHKLRYFQ